MSRRFGENLLSFRNNKTRYQKAVEKNKVAEVRPVSLGCVHLHSDGNLGFMVRAAACFGAKEVLVIGSIPEERILRQFSCSMNFFINIKSFPNSREFLRYTRKNNIHIVSLEICERSKNILDYKFPMNKEVCILTGNESTGVPNEIIMKSDCISIPNPGPAPCMNTSQAANVALFEYTRQRSVFERN